LKFFKHCPKKISLAHHAGKQKIKLPTSPTTNPTHTMRGMLDQFFNCYITGEKENVYLHFEFFYTAYLHQPMGTQNSHFYFLLPQ